MSSNRQGGQGTQKSGQKPMPEREQDERYPGKQQQEEQEQGQGGPGRQQPKQGQQPKQDRPVGGRENR